MATTSDFLFDAGGPTAETSPRPPPHRTDQGVFDTGSAAAPCETEATARPCTPSRLEMETLPIVGNLEYSSSQVEGCEPFDPRGVAGNEIQCWRRQAASTDIKWLVDNSSLLYQALERDAKRVLQSTHELPR